MTPMTSAARPTTATNIRRRCEGASALTLVDGASELGPGVAGSAWTDPMPNEPANASVASATRSLTARLPNRSRRVALERAPATGSWARRAALTPEIVPW